MMKTQLFTISQLVAATILKPISWNLHYIQLMNTKRFDNKGGSLIDDSRTILNNRIATMQSITCYNRDHELLSILHAWAVNN